MRTFMVVLSLFVCGRQCLAEYYATSNYFCRELSRQQIVDINQLEGMWYLIEKIIHTEERHLTVNMTTCPVIHIAEDRSYATTYNPLYKTYDTTYGAGYPHNVPTIRNPTDPRSTFTNEQDYLKQREEYDRRTTYDYERRRGLHSLYLKDYFSTKHLKIYMSDGSSNTEHHLRYNGTNPGFWIISGLGEGTQDNLKHFAGTIQVLKAVGSHLVLTVCQSSREVKELYTMILSRENYLDIWDIHSVQGMLLRQGLSTNYIQKTCNDATVFSLNSILSVFVLATCIFEVVF